MFEWNDSNRGHIWRRHRVQPEECEEALNDPYSVPLAASDVAGVPREAALGLTEMARLLWVPYEPRGTGYRVVTARSANQREARLY